MRFHALFVVVALLIAVPTALAARSHWIGAGYGRGSSSGGQCSVTLEVEIDRYIEDATTWDIFVLTAPTDRDLCYFPSWQTYMTVPGTLKNGWERTFVESCGTRHIAIGGVGSLPAGLTEISFQGSTTCGGGWAYAQVALAPRDPL